MTAILVASIVVTAGLCLLGRKSVRTELYDIIEFHTSRWRARRRLPRARVTRRSGQLDQ